MLDDATPELEGAALAHFLDDRCGKLTASRMADAMAFIEDRSADYTDDGRQIKYVMAPPKKPNVKFEYIVGEKPEKLKPSADRNNYMRDLLSERVTNNSIRHYVSAAMQHGLDYESTGKVEFEIVTGESLIPCGTIDHPDIEFFAATPDSLIGTDACFELKCPTSPVYLSWLIAGVVPEEHKPQMIAQCVCTGRPRSVFCAFDPFNPDRDKRLFVREWFPSAEEIDRVQHHARHFLRELDQMFTQYANSRGTL